MGLGVKQFFLHCENRLENKKCAHFQLHLVEDCTEPDAQVPEADWFPPFWVFWFTEHTKSTTTLGPVRIPEQLF